MLLHATSRRHAATMLALAICVVTACVAASSAGAAKPRPKAFCAGAKSLATLDTKTLKDVTSNVDVTNPGYVSKQFGDSLSALHVMYLHAPAAILATSKQYLNAYIEYGKQIGETHWNLQPTDPGDRKIVEEATKTYAPVATSDLPKLDSFVKKTCGFGLNLLTAPPK